MDWQRVGILWTHQLARYTDADVFHQFLVDDVRRTLAVARTSRSAGAVASGVVVRLRNLYGTTTGAFAVILGLAIWLAHG